VEHGKQLSAKLITSGQALEKFREMIRLQGGDPQVIDNPGKMPRAKHEVRVSSPRSGFVDSIQCEQVGTACVILGGGREKKEDSIDHSVGIVLRKKVGDPVSAGEALCSIYCHSDGQAERAKKILQESYRVEETPPAERRPLIHRVIERKH
jgi:thymidine phosphorylase